MAKTDRTYPKAIGSAFFYWDGEPGGKPFALQIIEEIACIFFCKFVFTTIGQFKKPIRASGLVHGEFLLEALTKSFADFQ
ncbi:hypothetical protein, partial [Enterobacter sp. JH587]|uniref:hypothetical protein n=1 Tax=Enterobacter sp. JH587 TaxID=2962891 RepID=UPI00227CD08B